MDRQHPFDPDELLRDILRPTWRKQASPELRARDDRLKAQLKAYHDALDALPLTGTTPVYGHEVRNLLQLQWDAMRGTIGIVEAGIVEQLRKLGPNIADCCSAIIQDVDSQRRDICRHQDQLDQQRELVGLLVQGLVHVSTALQILGNLREIGAQMREVRSAQAALGAGDPSSGSEQGG